MAIPDFQTAMLPILRFLDGGARTTQEMHDVLAREFALTPDEIAQRLPSGRAAVFSNRLGWARFHLKSAGLLDVPRRGVYQLTARGRDALREGGARVDMSYLARFPEYVAARSRAAGTESGVADPPAVVHEVARTPDDLLEDGYRQLRAALVADLRERIAAMAPRAFEQLVVDLLVRMGYGGPQPEAGLVVGGTGDEGIDGVIREDRLGLDTIYVQAKRWAGVVGRPEIQRFAGALQGQRARKGVFITTSSFTREASSYADAIQTTIVLVDGAMLAELMIDHDVAVTRVKSFDVKRVDSDYFGPE